MGQSPLFWICITLLIFLIGREIMCWYWRINEIIKIQERHTEILEDILIELRKSNTLQKNNKSTP